MSKRTLTAFNRICSTDLVAFESLVTKLLALDNKSPYFVNDLSIYQSLIKEEFEKLEDKLDTFLNMDQLPEGLEEETLLAAVSKFKDIRLQSELFLNRAMPKPMASSTIASATMGEFNQTINNSSMLSSSDLPRLSLPTFDGKDPAAFNEFYSKFKIMVIDNPVLTPKQKLVYLLNHLKGSAYQKISLLPIDDQNFQLAIDTLTERYQNSKLMPVTFWRGKPVPPPSLPAPSAAPPKEDLGSQQSMSVSASSKSTSVLMATCLVRVQVNPKRFLIARAILDSASQVSFISEACAQKLGVNRFNSSVKVCGIGLATPPASKGCCKLTVANIGGQVLTESHTFHILPQIAQCTPRVPISPQVFEAAKHLVLSDPTFGQPSKVDLLLNAELVAASLNGTIFPLGKGLPMAVSTIFGFVLMGTAPIANEASYFTCVNSSSPMTESGALQPVAELPLDSCLSQDCMYSQCLVSSLDGEHDSFESFNRFWELEEPPQVEHLVTDEEKLCEEHFVRTTTRLPSGRFVISLPFKIDHDSRLGNSFNSALSRFHALERKFNSNPTFKSLYVDFMRDYVDKGHMSLVTDITYPKYYIPHHGIFRTHGDKSKIRVVFDASCKSSTGYSLNDVLDDRRYNFVFCADIQQMFRQILVSSEDSAYQCILWRETRTDPISIYALRTVTYGTTCAPYLAIRCLLQLAQEEGMDFPLAKRALEANIFVDDFACGSNTLAEARRLKTELVELLGRGGFVLKKWASNCSSLLDDICLEDQTPNNFHGILGLSWDPVQDTLSYPTHEMVSSCPSPLSKRSIMSQTARLYDPCGFISPIVMRAKCFMQTLWRNSLGWDEHLPANLVAEWEEYYSSLSHLGEITFPRFLNMLDVIELHAFSDASQLGYAACLYVRCSILGSTSCRLLTAKAKVAPLKTVSIPRLELQGAHLMSKLVYHYVNLFKPYITISGIVLWTDSTIVLQWVKTPPHMLKTFIANRVAQISDYVGDAQWRHVPGDSNPADLASRGADCVQFLNNFDLWHLGPPWLSQDITTWPNSSYDSIRDPDVLELKPDTAQFDALASLEQDSELFSNFSSWTTVVRVTMIIIKWHPRYRPVRHNFAELSNHAHNYVMRYIQLSSFSKDMSGLKNGKLPSSLALRRLSPFLDEFGLLRARGRLSNAEDSPTPIILPKKHHLVSLLIRHTHVRLGHAGPLQVRYALSSDYWILAARQVIRSIIFKCVVCFRAKPKSLPL
ncbi:uncharacterized protein LOC131843520 [Achroia grisella]|uniref:uncharacterized protein LOC131843520 n=1 Tax=Achroia grisella TaxID=688607 RepID=UPI0027D2418D|nr:uncharacterized protein LOC131843520 [Achroia grisella]